MHTTPNYGFQVPDIGDSNSAVITELAYTISSIDTIIKTVATLGTSPGLGLKVIPPAIDPITGLPIPGSQKLQVDNGFGLVFNANQLAVSIQSLVLDPAIGGLGNKFELYTEHVNIGVTNYDPVQNTVHLQFVPSFNGKVKQVQTIDNGSNNVLTVAWIEKSTSDASNPQFEFVAFSENQHQSSNIVNTPLVLDSINNALGSNVNNVINFKLVYVPGILTNPLVQTEYVLGVLYNNGGVGTIQLFTINLNPHLPPSVFTASPFLQNTTNGLSADLWDINAFGIYVALAYLPTSARTPIGIVINVDTNTVSAPISLYPFPIPTGSDIESISLASDASHSGTFTAWYLEVGPPPILHAWGFTTASTSLGDGSNQPVTTSLTGPLFAATGINGNSTVVAGLSSQMNTIQVFYHLSDPVFNLNPIQNEAQLLVPLHPVIDKIWGFVKSGSSHVLVYHVVNAAIQYEMTYASFTVTGTLITQSIVSDIDITETLQSKGQFLLAMPSMVSNAIATTINQAGSPPGVVIYFSDINYQFGKNRIHRLLFGGSQFDDLLPDRWPSCLNIQYKQNPDCSIRIPLAVDGTTLFNPLLGLGNPPGPSIPTINPSPFPGNPVTISSTQSLCDIVMPDNTIAWIHFAAAGGPSGPSGSTELGTLTTPPTVYTRDITHNGILNIPVDLTLGVNIAPISTFSPILAHDTNVCILFFRQDSYTEALLGASPQSSNDVYIWMGDGTGINLGAIKEGRVNRWHGPGLTGSGNSQRVDPGPYLTFDDSGKLTIVQAQPGLNASPTTLIDNSLLTYTNEAVPLSNPDTQSVFREVFVVDPALVNNTPVVFQFRLHGNPTLITIKNIKLYQSEDTTLTTINDANDAVLEISTKIADIPIASSVPYLGIDTLVTSEPIPFIPLSITQPYIIQYELSGDPGIFDQFFAYQLAAPPAYRTISGGSILPVDTDWSAPVDPLYGFYDSGPPFTGITSDPNFTPRLLGIIHTIETASFSTPQQQGIVVSGPGGTVDHNSLSNLQGGNPSHTEEYHLTHTEHDDLTLTPSGVGFSTPTLADALHGHAHNETAGLQGGILNERLHLTQVQHDTLTNGPASDASSLHTHLETMVGDELDFVGAISVNGVSYAIASAVNFVTVTVLVPLSDLLPLRRRLVWRILVNEGTPDTNHASIADITFSGSTGAQFSIFGYKEWPPATRRGSSGITSYQFSHIYQPVDLVSNPGFDTYTWGVGVWSDNSVLNGSAAVFLMAITT